MPCSQLSVLQQPAQSFTDGVTSPAKVLSQCFLETGVRDQGAGRVGFLRGSSIGFFMVTFSGLVLTFLSTVIKITCRRSFQGVQWVATGESWWWRPEPAARMASAVRMGAAVLLTFSS